MAAHVATHSISVGAVPVLQPSGRRVSLNVRTNKTKHVVATAVAAKVRTSVAPGSAERDILSAISQVQGRGKSGLTAEEQEALENAVLTLEESGTGVKDPTKSELLQGRWKLLYTTRPSSASPIQKSFVGVSGFSVYQDISLSGDEARVNNIVDFGSKIGFLKVEAAAQTDAKPIPGFEPRKGRGLPFGLLGTSSVDPPSKVHTRIDFQFDTAAFNFKALPLTVPYPVPFRLLGDERKGWLDVTYLSKDGSFRLSRGNKGTLFILVKEDGVKEKLLKASTLQKNQELIESLVNELLDTEQGTGISSRPAYAPQARGAWRLVWTQQGETANPLQQKLVQVVRNWQIISSDGTTLQNRVDLIPGLVKVIAQATAEPASATRTRVVISEVLLQIGPLKFNLNIRTDADGYVDWLYLDDTIRITRGNKGSLFFHIRDPTIPY
jgi:hypothetical protein